jgi:hypothetical protein
LVEAEGLIMSTDNSTAPSRPFDVGVTFHHDLYDLADVVFRTRAIQAFESVATRYPIHRLVRCAVARDIEQVFDELALQAGLAPQRLDRGSLLLDGPGVFVHAEGKRKADYCSCTFNLWADSKVRAEEVRTGLLNAAGKRLLPEEMFVIDWHFCNSKGALLKCSFEEVAREALLDEAYPSLGSPLHDFVRRYLSASETVLILQGPPGSGKTRLVRHVLAALSRRKGDSAEVMYTSDKRALESDEIFVEFITGTHDAFVIEDADHLLLSRARGNHDLHRFLSIADGVVRAQGRKIIFTTNLPNLNDLDDALLRPGRCFAVVRTRPLSEPEIERLLVRLCGREQGPLRSARAALGAEMTRGASVAQVYRACTQALRQ